MSIVEYHNEGFAYRQVSYDALDRRDYVAKMLKDYRRRWRFKKLDRNWLGKMAMFKALTDCSHFHFVTDATSHHCGFIGRAA